VALKPCRIHRKALRTDARRGEFCRALFALDLLTAVADFSASEVIDAMEAAGIEPASADAPDRTSTSVVCALVSPGGRFADDLPTD